MIPPYLEKGDFHIPSAFQLTEKENGGKNLFFQPLRITQSVKVPPNNGLEAEYKEKSRQLQVSSCMLSALHLCVWLCDHYVFNYFVVAHLLTITIFCPCRLIIISCLHFWQNSGKFSRIVSGGTLVRVLFPQIGHNIHFSFSNAPPPFIIVFSYISSTFSCGVSNQYSSVLPSLEVSPLQKYFFL